LISRVIDLSARHRYLVVLLAGLAAGWGWWSLRHMPVDAIPDLTDTQVIVYSHWDRSPDIIEDQVTHPIISALVGAPKVKAVRGQSDFGYSWVYVIFEDGTDPYWARSRTLEYLSPILSKLPRGVETELGPDATGLGWVFQYALTDKSGKQSLADLRSYQDWYLRSYLKSVPGVADVASLGGYPKQFQVNLDPNRLKAYGIPIGRVVEAVKSGNSDTGGRLLESSGVEYMVRGRGYIRDIEDIRNMVLAAGESGSSIRIRDVGEVVIGPDIRRGASDLNGEGEAVFGIVIMRQGENTLEVIERVKARLKQLEPGLPAGVIVQPVYDRSELIHSAIGSLRITLVQVAITVALVILLFLAHVPSAIIPIITIPVTVLIAFVPFRALGITANIMSLGGIAIAIGALVDAAIVVVEQTHKKLEEWERTGGGEYRDVIIAAVKEVGGPSFFALLVIAVSFLPVLTLEAQEGRLFKPLAYTKSLAMLVAAVLAITLDPALRLILSRFGSFRFRPVWLARVASSVLAGRVRAEKTHVLSRACMRAYEPVLVWSLRQKRVMLAGAIALMLLTVPVASRLGSEFMPSLDEGSLLYMPSTMPGISIGEAHRLLQETDRIIRRFPEVEKVFGKAGRSETATDPAPLSMMETVISLKPKSRWRAGIRSREELVAELDRALQVPGISNAWTMPMKGRIDMLTTGIRTPVGLKISGSDWKAIELLGAEVERTLASVKGTRSVFAERTGSGYYLDIDWNRDALAHFGLSIDEAQTAVQNAIGGENVTTVIHGQERYPVSVRYMRDFRSDADAIGRVLVPSFGGQIQTPLAELAAVHMVSGPSMLRDEGGLLTGYVYVDVAGRSPGSYVEEAAQVVREKVRLPAGYAVLWSGQYEAMVRVRERLQVILPLTLLLVILLLYANTRSMAKTCIVLMAVPFSAIGAVWILYFLGYSVSVAVWVGLIALLGVDAETGIFMLLYLDLTSEQARRAGRLTSKDELREAIRRGAVKRLRPKLMTVATMMLGLVPIMWSTGVGADVMKRIAAPMIGGIVTSFLLELLIYPALYETWKWNFGMKQAAVRIPEPAVENLGA
jgi:Cu(I)/Ag(I) efflux system membrane protein CusA/SilA